MSSAQQLASHGLFNVMVQAEGDTWIDDHHTNEDIGQPTTTCPSSALTWHLRLCHRPSHILALPSSAGLFLCTSPLMSFTTALSIIMRLLLLDAFEILCSLSALRHRMMSSIMMRLLLTHAKFCAALALGGALPQALGDLAPHRSS